MKVREIKDDLVIANLIRPDPDRTKGLHLSTITGDIMRITEPRRFTGGKIRAEYAGLGVALEGMIGRAIRDFVFDWEKPGEFTRDGIIVSPDAIHDTLEEIKATWTKSIPGIEGITNPKLSRYHMQGKGYCYVLGMDTVVYRVLFLNGEYRPPVPVLRTFIVQYSKREILDNWEMHLQHAKDRGLT